MALLLEDRFKRVEKHLIGLWRFRQRGKKSLWCATFVFQGFYYDIPGKQTPGAALDAVYRELCALRKRHPDGSK